MGRTKQPDMKIIEDVALAPDLTQNQNILATVQTAYNDDRDLVNQLLGQAQMADAFAKFSVTVTTSKLAFVKENKLYRNLKGKKSGNGDQILDGTWAEFCTLLGMSREKADKDIGNLNFFGEEALASLSDMGIGYRELRQFRKLPEDQKTALIETAKSGDKESVLEFAEELISKQNKEKELLQKQVDDAKKETDSARLVSKGKDDRINQMATELTELQATLNNRIKTETPEQKGAAMRDHVTRVAYGAESVLRGPLYQAFDALMTHTNESGVPHDDFMAGILVQMQQAINQLREEFNIKNEPGQDEFSWAKED